MQPYYLAIPQDNNVKKEMIEEAIDFRNVMSFVKETELSTFTQEELATPLFPPCDPDYWEDIMVQSSPMFFDCSPSPSSPFSQGSAPLSPSTSFPGTPPTTYMTSSKSPSPPSSPPVPVSSDDEDAMEKFEENHLVDLKHIVYNLLVDNYNGHGDLAKPCVITTPEGVTKMGFQFNTDRAPDVFLPQFYARWIRKSRLDLSDKESILIQDLYKFYLRACLDLLAKYFVKVDKYTFSYDAEPLFVGGGSLEDADTRIKALKTLGRKREPRVKVRASPVKKQKR